MAAAAAIALYLLGAWSLEGVSGLVRTLVTNNSDRHELETRRVAAIDLDGVDPSAGRPSGVVAIWRGAWEIPASGLHDLMLASEGPSSWTIDGVVAHGTATFGGGATRRTVWLAAGFHAIEISYQVDVERPRIEVTVARAGERPTPLSAAVLKPRPPRNPRVRAIARWLHRGLGAIALLATVIAIRMSLLASAWQWPGWRRSVTVAPRAWFRAALAWTALACIVAHGALLRIDAITAKYGPVDAPSLVTAVQTRAFLRPEAIRPASVAWPPEPLYPHKDGTATHYRSDPYTYLGAARTMPSFYAAHFREPVFPFATKIFLATLGGRDVAVSFASAFFSVLAIWLTYLLGAAIWSRPVGLAAALGLSLDYDVITLASAGWRDDAYVAIVALCTYLMLGWWRAEDGSRRVYRAGRLSISEASLMAIGAGVAGGLAILTRIMAASFLAAGAAYFVLASGTPWRRRLESLLLFAASAILVAAPYFVNCWRVYRRSALHLQRARRDLQRRRGPGGMEGQHIGVRPREDRAAAVRNARHGGAGAHDVSGREQVARSRGLAARRARVGVARGDRRSRGAGGVRSRPAAPRPNGRVAGAVFVDVDRGSRFPIHRACLSAAVDRRGGVRQRARPRRSRSDCRQLHRGSSWGARLMAGVGGVVGVAVVALWFVWRGGPAFAFAEALRAHEEGTVMAGVRDGWSFRSGWSNVMRSGNVSVRVAAEEAALSIRLPEAGDYPITIRMDPFPRPIDASIQSAAAVEVALNGAHVTTIPLRWTAGRMGAYDVVLPAAAVRRGDNRLVLRVNGSASEGAPAVRPGLTPGEAVALWYVRVRPPAASAAYLREHMRARRRAGLPEER